MPKVPRHSHQVNCFQQGMLEFEGPMGQCFSRFPTVSSRGRGEKRKKEGWAGSSKNTMKLHSIDGLTQVGYAKQRPTVLAGAVCDYLDSFTLPVNPVSIYIYIYINRIQKQMFLVLIFQRLSSI